MADGICVWKVGLNGFPVWSSDWMCNVTGKQEFGDHSEVWGLGNSKDG